MTTASALFAAVYANPVDDAARAVLADFLQEKADPRGEFIALQLSRAADGARTRRESALLAANSRKWLGPLKPVIKANPTFERGFLATCALKCESVRNARALGRRVEWATVVDVDVHSWKWPAELLERMPALRVLRGAYDAIPAHPTVEQVVMEGLGRDKIEGLVTTKLPALRALEITQSWLTVDEMRPFLRSPLAKQLTSFALETSYPEGWPEALRALKLPRVSLAYKSYNPWQLAFEGAKVTARHIWTSGVARDANEDLAKMLAYIQDPAKLTLVVTTKLPKSKKLAAQLDRFAAHEFAG